MIGKRFQELQPHLPLHFFLLFFQLHPFFLQFCLLILNAEHSKADKASRHSLAYAFQPHPCALLPHLPLLLKLLQEREVGAGAGAGVTGAGVVVGEMNGAGVGGGVGAATGAGVVVGDVKGAGVGGGVGAATGAGVVVGGANGAGVGAGVGAATGAGVVVPIVTDAKAGLAEK